MECRCAVYRDSFSETVSLGGLFDVSVRAVSDAAFVSGPYFSLNQTILQACSEYFLYPAVTGKAVFGISVMIPCMRQVSDTASSRQRHIFFATEAHGITRKNLLRYLFFRVFPCASVANNKKIRHPAVLVLHP